MVHLSQNKKIAASAVVVFFVSFSVMLFFLKNSGQEFNNGAANLLAVGGHDDEENHEFDYSEIEAVQEYFDDDNAVLILDREGEIYGTSEEFCELLTVECEEIAHQPLIDFVHEKDVKSFAKGQAKMLNSEKDLDGLGPYRFSGKDNVAMVMLNAHPIVNKEGEADYIAVSVKDLTEDIEDFNTEKKNNVSAKSGIQKIVQRISFN